MVVLGAPRTRSAAGFAGKGQSARNRKKLGRTITQRLARRQGSSAGLAPPDALKSRYRFSDLEIFTDDERRRFFSDVSLEDLATAERDPAAWDRVIHEVAWELLYRIEPELYERLTLAEKLQPEIEAFLPETTERAVEVGAGSGRLTLLLASRCEELTAVEPSKPMRDLLDRKLKAKSISNTRVVNGFFDALPVADSSAGLVISCSAFTTSTSHGGEIGLREMERACSKGGMIMIIWPTDPNWFVKRGFKHVQLVHEPLVEFRNDEEAGELLEIFFPEASPVVLKNKLSFGVSELRSHVPRDLVYKSLL